MKLTLAEKRRKYKDDNPWFVEKNKARLKKWRADNKAKYNNYVRTRYIQKKLDAIEYKGGACGRCGSSKFHPAAYDFHHINPKEKEHAIGSLLAGSWDKVILELDKCILLCSNCHRTLHAEEE